jgi:hypothetical protein
LLAGIYDRFGRNFRGARAVAPREKKRPATHGYWHGIHGRWTPARGSAISP